MFRLCLHVAALVTLWKEPRQLGQAVDIGEEDVENGLVIGDALCHAVGVYRLCCIVFDRFDNGKLTCDHDDNGEAKYFFDRNIISCSKCESK